MLGLVTIGNEWDASACATAEAAGHARRQVDVAADSCEWCKGARGYIGSPPCTLFSAAGSGVGKLVLDVLTTGIRRIFAGDDPGRVIAEVRAAVLPVTVTEAQRKNAARKPEKRWTEDQVQAKAESDAFVAALVLEPARRIVALDPEWIALEQVPEVLPLWHEYARCLRLRGYSAWTVVLNAADYGVPQTRKRACLGASRVRATYPPVPTHTEHPQDADLFGESLLKWVSFYDAMDWGPDEPSHTVIRPAWTRERPATTVVGSFHPEVIAAPGYRTEESRQNAPDSVVVTVAEAGVLQSFPRDYPWQGSKGKQYQQVGNAVPPRLAAHVLAAITGRMVGGHCER